MRWGRVRVDRRACRVLSPRGRILQRRSPWPFLLTAFLCGAIGLILTLGTPAIGTAQDKGIESGRAELDRLKSEIESNRKRIASLQKKEKEAAALQASVEADRRLTVRYLDRLAEQERALREDHATQQAQLLEMQIQAEEAATRLRERLIRYHRFRNVSGEALLLSSESFSQLFARSQFLKRLIHSDQLELASLAQDREFIAQASTELEEKRAELDHLYEEKRAEERRLAAKSESAQQALSEIQGERTDHEKHLRQLEASQSQIKKMLEQLERERRERKERGLVTGPPPEGFEKGNLLWPVQGKVVANFGREIHPKYKTEVPLNGIVIGAPEGDPIVACASGEVVYVGWYDGYGRTVMLSHGGGFYTIYAHASKIRVAKGQRVGAGEVIAEVGDTDSTRGPCLHFEIRKEAEALDPRKWLR